jgi:hypothetical protein
MLLASFSLSLQSNFSAHIGLVWRIFALPFCTTITPHVCQLNAARNAFQTEKSIWRFSWPTEPVRRTQDWIDLDLGEMEQLARRFVKARIDFTERYA